MNSKLDRDLLGIPFQTADKKASDTQRHNTFVDGLINHAQDMSTASVGPSL